MNKTVFITLVALVFLAILAGESYTLIFLAQGSWDARLGLILQIIAFYPRVR
jgi:hypothetical protein